MKTEERKYLKRQNNLQVITLVCGAIAFCVTNYITIQNFIEDRESQRTATLLENKLIVYKEACKAAGIIVGDAEAKSTQVESSINNFEKLYWGEMSLIEDSSVVRSAKQLRIDSKAYLSSAKTVTDLDKLKKTVIKFTNVCQLSYKKSWNNILKEK